MSFLEVVWRFVRSYAVYVPEDHLGRNIYYLERAISRTRKALAWYQGVPGRVRGWQLDYNRTMEKLGRQENMLRVLKARAAKR